MLRSICLSLMFLTLLAIPGHQPLQFIAVGAIALESILVEQALGATPETHLIAVAGRAHRPAHAAVPAATKQHSSASQTGGHQAYRPQPARTLGFGRI
jgi:hypothetical protein